MTVLVMYSIHGTHLPRKSYVFYERISKKTDWFTFSLTHVVSKTYKLVKLCCITALGERFISCVVSTLHENECNAKERDLPVLR